jgi:hypothetical protein
MVGAVVAVLLLSYAPASEACRFADTRIGEASGISAGAFSDDIVFTHNDSGDAARFFAVDVHSGATLAVYGLDGAAADDWEDMARGRTADGDAALLFGDIGDNFLLRPTVTVYQVREPRVRAGHDGTVSVDHRFELRYDDGSHNAETLLVDPRTNTPTIVTKDGDGVSGVYQPRGEVLHRVAEIRFDRLVRRRGTYAAAATGGDVAADGRRVVVRTPFEAFEWDIGGGGLVAAFAGTPHRIVLPEERQGEAIAYTRDGRSLVTTSEGARAPVHLLRGDREVGPDLLTPRPVTRPTVTRRQPWPGVAVATVAATAVAVAAIAVLRARRGRRRRRRRPPGPGTRPA